MAIANFIQEMPTFINGQFSFSWPSPLVLFGGLTMVFIALYIGYLLFLAPFSQIPGPKHSKITSAAHHIDMLCGNLGNKSKDSYYKYGDIYTLGPRSVAISNPEDCRRVLGSTDFVKHPDYAGLAIEENVMISTLSEEDAHVRHKRVGPMFSHANLAKMEHILIDNGVKALFNKWDDAISQATADKPAEINYAWHLLMMSFDVACSHVYSRQFGMLGSGQMQIVKWIAGYRLVSSIGAFLSSVSRVLFEFLLSDAIKNKDDFFKFTRKLTLERCEKHLSGKNSEKKLDALESVLKAPNPAANFALSTNQVTAEVTAFLVANSSSTSETMCWTLHHMLLNPRTYCLAVEQARSKFTHSHTVTYQECKAHLPYVEACIYEGMRIHAISGPVLPRVVPRGGITVQGYYLPQGTTVAVNITGANHHRQTWHDPRSFLPERFIDDPMAKKNVFTFSFGARSCPGRNLALRQMLVVFANILKNYDFELPKDALFNPGNLDKHGYPQAMPSVQRIMIGPKYPERDCRVIIRKAPQE